jgi:hypothetical protein
MTETKKQRLTLYDTNNVMISFALVNKDSEVAFQDLIKTKMDVERESSVQEVWPFDVSH